MKKTLAFIGFLAVLSFTMGFTACNSTDSATQTELSAQQPAAPEPYFTGDGLKGMSIAIVAPKAKGLAKDQEHLPAVIQGELVSNFSSYSAMGVLDRENLDAQYKELYSGNYDDDSEELDWGHLPPTDYFLDGTITKTAVGYALQIRIAKNSDKMTVAYSGNCTFMELNNFTGIRRASLDLLQKIGVQVTERTKTELAGAARAQTVAAQTADARGYTADRGGRTAEAAIYYTQAAAIDPSMLQTASRASTLTAQIASGSIGAETRALIQQQEDWKALLAETEETIYTLISSASENPPYALYYSNDIQWSPINYQTKSRDARFETNLRGHVYWFDSVRIAAQSVYGAVYDGLNRTGHKDEWGLGNWPGRGVTQKNPFSTSWRHDINVVFELVNDQGKAISRQTYSKRAEYGPRRDGNQVSIAYNADDFATLTFNTVKAADMSDSERYSIRVASVNGAPPEQTPFRITMIPDWEDNTYLIVENGILRGFRSGVDTGRYRNLVIPATLWAEPVTAIGDNAFANKGLSSVLIPDSVITIGNSAFANNPLSYILIGKGVRSIVDNAFYYNQVPRSTSIGQPILTVSIPGNVISVPIPLSAEEKERYAIAQRRDLVDGIFSMLGLSDDPTAMANSDSIDDRISADAKLNSQSIHHRKYAMGFMGFYEREGKKAGKYTYGAGFFPSWEYSPKQDEIDEILEARLPKVRQMAGK